MAISAKDVQTLRQATGVGMMDCKRALEETGGDMEAAMELLRKKGLTKAAERADREASQGAVGLSITGSVGALVQLKCETDFVAQADSFKDLANALAARVAADGPDAVASEQATIDDLKITLKENISVGEVVRLEAAPGNVLDSYLHVQGGRGVNGVLVELAGGTAELAHDIAVHIGFAKPRYLHRDEVPAGDVAKERDILEAATRNEGKPEAAIAKIVEGKLNGFFKEIVLNEQAFAKDDKKSIAQVLGGATIVRYAQVVIG